MRHDTICSSQFALSLLLRFKRAALFIIRHTASVVNPITEQIFAGPRDSFFGCGCMRYTHRDSRSMCECICM